MQSSAKAIREQGFTLMELLLATALSALAGIGFISWFTSFHGELNRSTQDYVRVQQTHYWLHWLWRDVAREAAPGVEISFDENQQCLLYGDFGVRIRNRHLQWRPTQAQCESNGWQALHNPQQVQFDQISWSGAELCLTSRSASAPVRLHKECVAWIR